MAIPVLKVEYSQGVKKGSGQACKGCTVIIKSVETEVVGEMDYKPDTLHYNVTLC